MRRDSRSVVMETWDYIIVGAGASGCTLAGRLARQRPDARIALIESGSERSGLLTTVPAATALHFLVPTRYNHGYRTTPQIGLRGRRCDMPSGRGIGGSSSINAMVYVRGHPADYDEWQSLGCPGWAWADVLPYFVASEHNERGTNAWHGVDGPLNVADVREPHPLDAAFIESATQTGIAANPDFNGAYQEGAGYYQVTQRNGERWSAKRAFLPNPALPNLQIFSHSTALRILFEQQRAVGVAIARDNGLEQVLRARGEVVLTAGAIRTPQLLMCSGVGPPEALSAFGIDVVHASPHVGRNLQDHPDYLRCFRVRGTRTLGMSASSPADVCRALIRYGRNRSGVLTTNGAQSGAFVRTDRNLARPDIQLHFVTALLDNHARQLWRGHGFACHACVLRPKSRGTVQLNHADARTVPAIDPGFLDHPDDVRTMLRGVRLMNRVLAAPALARYAPRPLHAATDDSDAAWVDDIRHRTGSAYHPVGTCRMGADTQAVVDARLRVAGVSGLRVADVSVMPTLIGGNTQAAAIMIAQRAADWIAQAASQRGPI